MCICIRMSDTILYADFGLNGSFRPTKCKYDEDSVLLITGSLTGPDI
jgi:hypothetical protein